MTCPDEPLVPREIRDELLTRILAAAEELLDLGLPERLHLVAHILAAYEDELLEATTQPEAVH